MRDATEYDTVYMANGDVCMIDLNDIYSACSYTCVLLKLFAIRLKTQPYSIKLYSFKSIGGARTHDQDVAHACV
jgi:hypothetical protein